MLPTLRKGRPWPQVDLHPDVAAQYDIKDGDWVVIETKRGSCRQRANIVPGIDPRVVHVQSHWWFPEQKGPHHGIWASNANRLTSHDGPYDPGMGTYYLRGMLCSIRKADPDNLDAGLWAPEIHPNYQRTVADVQEFESEYAGPD
ncbi:MAG: hypothetical protein O3A84_01370 [Proteobacteria bacterium]|nr:hypothetical protein [Pseudomonadota bacterium]